MSEAYVDQQRSRPGMRRKSSASNLLTTFAKPPPVNIAAATAGTMGIGGIGMYPMTPTGASTPIAPQWETSEGINSPQIGSQGTSLEYLRDLVHKRILTLTYLRSIHEGKSHWFHTILLTRHDLDREFPNNLMKKRTLRFAVLAMSLSSLLDINSPHDLLRGLLNTLQEYDQSKVDRDGESESSSRPKMRGLFRAPKSKRGAAAGGPEFIDPEASYLVTPHLPFSLDYHQTLLSLLDVLSEVYNKIGKIFGPSPLPPSSNQQMILGALAPYPGVSYLFASDNGMDIDGSLWAIANAGINPNTFVVGTNSTQQQAGLGEMVLKIDGKFKKITSVLLKELDQFARNTIKDELNTLDPLLRNMEDLNMGSGKVLYDYEG
ncbi:hypothetical protein DL96DRAFT_1598448 [Flagelloscypha sp. PMI_526]|nr:hypothetical protein DL96DRAFT_1598448 [Flagelloscypha sp. PMI_526]